MSSRVETPKGPCSRCGAHSSELLPLLLPLPDGMSYLEWAAQHPLPYALYCEPCFWIAGRQAARRSSQTVVRVETVSELVPSGSSYRVTVVLSCGHRSGWAGLPERTPRVGELDSCLTCWADR